MKKIAFIPARSGSKRIPNKNIMDFYGHPLMAYSICTAIDSGVFDAVMCITDSKEYAEIARHYGATVPQLRPSNISEDTSPDIEWVQWIFNLLKEEKYLFDIFSILRPTNPFRQAATIRRAIDKFLSAGEVDSLRAVEPCKQHPGKMWTIQSDRMLPLYPFSINETPWHSNQYTALPKVYIQNASLEIAWSKVVYKNNSISGQNILPFLTQEYEGFDINRPEDLILADNYLSNGAACLPDILC